VFLFLTGYLPPPFSAQKEWSASFSPSLEWTRRLAFSFSIRKEVPLLSAAACRFLFWRRQSRDAIEEDPSHFPFP